LKKNDKSLDVDVSNEEERQTSRSGGPSWRRTTSLFHLKL